MVAILFRLKRNPTFYWIYALCWHSPKILSYSFFTKTLTRGDRKRAKAKRRNSRALETKGKVVLRKEKLLTVSGATEGSWKIGTRFRD